LVLQDVLNFTALEMREVTDNAEQQQRLLDAINLINKVIHPKVLSETNFLFLPENVNRMLFLETT